MGWDLGAAALLELAALSVVVGLVNQLRGGPDATPWLWVRVSTIYFVVGAWITDAWFGWVSPGGLTFEEMLLIGLAPLPAVALVVLSTEHGSGHRTRRRGKPPRASRHPSPRPF
jgi:hypothetical protein